MQGLQLGKAAVEGYLVADQERKVGAEPDPYGDIRVHEPIHVGHEGTP